MVVGVSDRDGVSEKEAGLVKVVALLLLSKEKRSQSSMYIGEEGIDFWLFFTIEENWFEVLMFLLNICKGI